MINSKGNYDFLLTILYWFIKGCAIIVFCFIIMNITFVIVIIAGIDINEFANNFNDNFRLLILGSLGTIVTGMGAYTVRRTKQEEKDAKVEIKKMEVGK